MGAFFTSNKKTEKVLRRSRAFEREGRWEGGRLEWSKRINHSCDIERVIFLLIADKFAPSICKLDFTNTNTVARTFLFSKIFFMFEVERKTEKSLKGPGNRAKSHQIHCTSIAIAASRFFGSVSEHLPLFNSQFPSKIPEEKLFTFTLRISLSTFRGCWVWHGDFVSRSLPGATHFQ